jgi:hypothetical protein
MLASGRSARNAGAESTPFASRTEYSFNPIKRAMGTDVRPMVTTATLALRSPRPSAGALVFTARRLRAGQLAILLGVRDSETGRFEDAGLPELRLPGLGQDAAAKVLATTATDGGRPAPKFRMLTSAPPTDPKPKIRRRGTLSVRPGYSWFPPLFSGRRVW